MFYTLTKFLGWGLLLAVIGVAIGWALRSVTGRARNSPGVDLHGDAAADDEVDELRGRLAEFDEVVAERDRLRIQLADVRHADSPGVVAASLSSSSILPEIRRLAEESERSDGSPGGVDVDSEHDVEGATDDADAPRHEIADDALDERSAIETDALGESAGEADPDLDLAAAAGAIGRAVRIDDLTLVDGIGPKISELCNGIGVTTWRELADSEVSELQSMLDAAGSRYSVHDPQSWPRQAELLASGRWEEFAAMTDEMRDGRASR